jgi:hypothetical protein
MLKLSIANYKRTQDSLSPRSNDPQEKRSAYLFGARSRALPSERAETLVDRAIHLNQRAWGKENRIINLRSDSESVVTMNSRDNMIQRASVILLWKKLGCQAENDWARLGIITRILACLMLTNNSDTNIRKILRAHIAKNGLNQNIEYETSKLINHPGPAHLIDPTDFDAESDATFLYKLMKTSIPDSELMIRLNRRRVKRGAVPVSHSTIYRFKHENPMVLVTKRGKKVSMIFIIYINIYIDIYYNNMIIY